MKKRTQKKQTGKRTKKQRGQGIRITTLLVLVLVIAAVSSSAGLYGYLTLSNVSEAGLEQETAASDASEEVDETILLSDDADILIVDDSTAMQALEAVSTALGISDPEEEYQYVDSFSGAYYNVYRFQQYYNGIRVYGYSVKVVADSTGEFEDVTGDYAQIGELDTSYQIAADDVSKYVLLYLKSEYDCSGEQITLSDPEQVILFTGEDEAQIAYMVDVYTAGLASGTVFVDGTTGDVIADQDINIYDSVLVTLEGQQESRTVSLSQIDEEDYYYYDEERNIAVYYGETYTGTDSEMLTVKSGITLSDVQKDSADALYNTELVWDFYSDVLGRSGMSGQTNMLRILVDIISYDDSGNRVYNNASFSHDVAADGGNYIGIMPKSEEAVTMSCYENVLAHEYTHGVISYSADLGANIVTYDPQLSTQYAIDEGLSDIMAELSEDYSDDGILNDSCDWDHTPSRNIADAESDSGQLTHASDFEDGKTDCHDGSTIVSYAAYLMNCGLSDKGYTEYDLLSTFQMANLYYDTILKLTENVTFTGLRSQLERVAIQMNMAGDLTDDELETVIDSMDYVGIDAILPTYRVEQGGSLTILDIDGEEYDRYTITIEKGLGGEVIVNNLSASSATYTLSYSIVPGYYWVTLTDRENPDLTESFYLLVNDNCEMNAGKITEYPSAQDVATDFGAQEQEVVLVLDVSGSMSGTPLSDTISAAREFVSTVLEETPGSKISIVTYEDEASTLVCSSDSQSELISCIRNISTGDGTNIYAGLQNARSIFSDSEAEQKMIVLMSDGLPNRGEESGGSYETSVINLASSIKADDVTIYALGFFSKLSGSDLSDGISLMKQVASTGYYYNLASDDIQDVFADMATLVNGTRYYNITLACPVEVSITYAGETLSSSEELGSTRTSFGSVTFEGENEDNQTKIVRLLDGYDYEICVYGTGEGTMDYTISVPDEDGAYTDVRTFEDVPITELTQIVSDTDTAGRTVLQVDTDSDGRTELSIIAGRNGTGEQMSRRITRYVKYILLAVFLLAVVTEILLVRRRYLRNRVCDNCGTPLSDKAKFCPQCGQQKHRVRLFIPERRQAKPRSKAANLALGIVSGICIVLICVNVLIAQADATKVYDRVRSHELESAMWLYEGSVSESFPAKAYLSGLLADYAEEILPAYEAGQVSKAYAQEICETIVEMNLEAASAQAEACLETLQTQ